jgi:hypothetical protein
MHQQRGKCHDANMTERSSTSLKLARLTSTARRRSRQTFAARLQGGCAAAALSSLLGLPRTPTRAARANAARPTSHRANFEWPLPLAELLPSGTSLTAGAIARIVCASSLGRRSDRQGERLLHAMALAARRQLPPVSIGSDAAVAAGGGCVGAPIPDGLPARTLAARARTTSVARGFCLLLECRPVTR